MSINHISISKETLTALAASDVVGPFQMLNLLKFKKFVAEHNKSGLELYRTYMKAAYPFFLESKATIVYDGEAIMPLIGPSTGLEWDKMLIVEYPSKRAFISMITNPDYPTELRQSALEDSRLILFKSKEKA